MMVVIAVYGVPPLYITGIVLIPLPGLSLIFTAHSGLVLAHCIDEETESERVRDLPRPPVEGVVLG